MAEHRLESYNAKHGIIRVRIKTQRPSLEADKYSVELFRIVLKTICKILQKKKKF